MVRHRGEPQAVPPDEHQWIESHGAPRSYRRLRTLIRDYYRAHYRLTQRAARLPNLNPGAGSVSRLCHEPRVALAALYQMLAPHISSGRLRILLNFRPVAADVEGDRIRSVTCKETLSGQSVTLSAPYVIDATELGDLLPLTGAEYVTGFESQQQTGEPHKEAGIVERAAQVLHVETDGSVCATAGIHIENPSKAEIREMLRATQEGVARVVASLRSAGHTDDT